MKVETIEEEKPLGKTTPPHEDKKLVPAPPFNEN